MKIWYDALTGKHMRYGVSIARRLRRLGHEVRITTREHPDTLPLAKFLREETTVVGRYNPDSLATRMKQSAQRQLEFCRIFERNIPEVAVSHGSADQCRVAFGLGIPVISTVDTPYAAPVHKLTLPLSKYIVASKAIPDKVLESYNVDGEIVGFNGVDEVAWIKDTLLNENYEYHRPLIVMRQPEEKAAYAESKVNMLAIAKKLVELGTVVLLSRYTRKKIKGLIVPEAFVDSVSLVGQADLFVGVGGTITREAALQGTPAIIINLFADQYVNDFLIQKGFPIYRTNQSNAAGLCRKLVGKKHGVKHLLEDLENPLDPIQNIIESLNTH